MVLGVFALARRRLDALGAFLAAAVFSLQPANVEVVGWVSGRSTGLCTALLVAALWVNGEAQWRAGPRAWGTALLLLGACLAKEVALVAPLFLLLWDRTRPDQEEPGALRPLAACGVMALAAGALALSERYRELLAHSLALRAPGRNLLESAQVIPTVLSAWVRPGWLALPHPPADAERWPVWLGAGMVLVLLLLASTLSRRAPLVALAAGWVVIALLPTHSLLAKTELMTAKPLYLAWVGPSLLLGGLASALVGRIRTERARRLLPAGLALILASAGALVWTEVAAWSDAVALGSRTVARNPRDAAAWNLLGAALQAAGRQREAVQAFRSASDLAPSSVRMRQHLSTAVLLCGDCSPEERRLP